MEGKTKGFIGGIGCRFPQSDDVQEFWSNLESGKDMIGCSRWPKSLYGLPPRSGCIKDLSLFDAEFFGIKSKEEIHEMNQLLRLLCEVTYESIVDSGLTLDALQKEAVGFYLACTFSDTDVVTSSQKLKANQLHNGSTLVSSLTSTFNLHGPACSIDTACSSSFSALHTACRDLETGLCKYAIVAGSNIIDNPNCSLKFHRLSMLSPTGTSNVFDKSANGYVRSDGVAAILISRDDKDLPRIYACIANIGVNCDGYKEEGIIYPSQTSQANLLKQLYQDRSTNDIAYVEAHGTGTQAGDKIETTALASVLCKNRKKPLIVGSVKSNMGHCEATAGLAGLIKCLLCVHHGKIPGNLNFKTPNPAIEVLNSGEIKVVDKMTELPDGLIGINCFGFGGVNGHAIIKPYRKQIDHKDKGMKLMLLSARTTAMMENSIKFVKNNINDACFLTLISRSMIANEKRYPVRGYLEVKDMKGHYTTGVMGSKDLWLVVDFLTTSWSSKEYLELRKIIKEWDLHSKLDKELVKVYMEEKKHSKVAMSLILITILKICDVKISGYVGCGLGELVAAYLDGCLTLQQCVQIEEAILETLKECEKVYPWYALHMPTDEIYQLSRKVKVVSIRDQSDAIILITVKEQHEIKSILQDIHAKGGVYNYLGDYPPLHTSLFNAHTSSLQKKLESVIATPKMKSSCFLSATHRSNIHKNSVNAAYFTDILTKPCHLYQSMPCLPKDVILVDVCVEDCCCHSNCNVEIPPISRIHYQSSSLLDSIGNLHLAGIDVNVEPINNTCDHFPLDCKTPPIGHLVKWDHSEKWKTIDWYQYSCQVKDEKPDVYSFSLHSQYSAEALFIYHIWQASMLKSQIQDEKSIRISINSGNPHVFSCGSHQLAHVSILSGQKQFLVTVRDEVGEIWQVLSGSYELNDELQLPTIPSYDVDINQNVEKSEGEDDVEKIEIMWEDSWLEYLDNLINFSSSLVTTDLTDIFINSTRHKKDVSDCASILTMYEPTTGVCKSGGVVLKFDTILTSKNSKEWRTAESVACLDTIPDCSLNQFFINNLVSDALCLSYAGVNSEKDHMAGIVVLGGWANHHLSLELTENVQQLKGLLPYITAYFYIHDKVNLQENQTILFLPPLGNTALLMIWMAIKKKSKVYVAVHKNSMMALKSILPEMVVIPDDKLHIKIKKLTKGKGCDVCVSIPDCDSFEHIPLETSVEWLADNGHFLFRYPELHGQSVGMGMFLRNITLTACDPIQDIRSLSSPSENERKELSDDLTSETFQKLCSMIDTEYDSPYNQVFKLTSTCSLHTLISITDELGAGLDELRDCLSQSDRQILDTLQDKLFIPREYSLEKENTDTTPHDKLQGNHLNEGLLASRLNNGSSSTLTCLSPLKSCVTPKQNVDDTEIVHSTIRIIPLSGTPKIHHIQPSTSTPFLTFEIQCENAELDQSVIQGTKANEYSLDSPAFRCRRRPSAVFASPAFTRLRGNQRKYSSVSGDVDEKDGSAPQKVAQVLKHTPKKLLNVPTTLDLLIVGPSRSPCTPEMRRHLTPDKFEPTLIPLNNKTGHHFFIVHPIIGGVKTLRPLAESLDVACYGIQKTAYTPETSIKSVASYYVNAIEMMNIEEHFSLGGFSYGGMIAFEMALQLQTKGRKVEHLVMLDGSPHYVKSQIKFIHDQIPSHIIYSQISPLRKVDEQMEVGYLLWFINMFGPIKQKGLIASALQGLQTTDARIEMAVNFMMGNVVMSPCPARTKWLTAKHKIAEKKSAGMYSVAQEVIRVSREEKARELVKGAKMANKHPVTHQKFQGDIHLVRIKQDIEYATNLGADYGLGELCTGKVHTKYCDGTHDGFLTADKVHQAASFLADVFKKK